MTYKYRLTARIKFDPEQHKGFTENWQQTFGGVLFRYHPEPEFDKDGISYRGNLRMYGQSKTQVEREFQVQLDDGIFENMHVVECKTYGTELGEPTVTFDGRQL